ncbi:MAG: protein translocase subunit SecD [Proteobacteria bacterium]|nr:protein translocase subunit SecD [Pseudomonadota bacterium]
MNKIALWKTLLILFVMLIGFLYALPNIFGDDPALQITREDGTPVLTATIEQAEEILNQNEINFNTIDFQGNALIIRLSNTDDQQSASALLRESLNQHVVALTLASRAPRAIQNLGFRPMSLGLDLRGGVYFLYQVDLASATQQYLDSYQASISQAFRSEGIPVSVQRNIDNIIFSFDNEESIIQAEELLFRLDPLLDVTAAQSAQGFQLNVALSNIQITQRQNIALQQNILTLRNRVNELGVAEPVVQRQGLDRILVQLPGIQDPSQAERILGSTATIEFRLVDFENDPFEADRTNRPPLNSILRYDRTGFPELLRREVIVSGSELTDATFMYSQGQPAVSIRLNAQGAARMLDATQANLNRPMAVLFIEDTPELVEVDGATELISNRTETVINKATIRGVFSNSFQITGVTPFEGQDLALLLRSGSLATPIVKVEERTIGPSLGQDNIDRGRLAVVVGLIAVMLFMILYYRAFGIIANVALISNVVLIVGTLSFLQASLTLPGIAGIVLTIGMAVDANVLIFERIREELRNGVTPLASIKAGYEKALSTIADANITTFIAAIVLFTFGTGPIKGFAITLAIGIATSMFTSIMVSRLLVNLFFERKARLQSLPIGIKV